VSQKWNARLLPKQRIDEYLNMLLGSWQGVDNNVRSAAIQTMYKMLNEQADKCFDDAQNRWKARHGIPVKGPNGDEIIVARPKKESKQWPQWKKHLFRLLP